MKLQSLLLTVGLCGGLAMASVPTEALAQQSTPDREKARKDSIAQATIIRLDQNSNQAPRRDTMRAGAYDYKEKTQIVRKDGKDSVIVTDRQYSYKPDANAVKAQPVQPVSTPSGYDPMSQERQEVLDKIEITLKDLDDELGMINDLHSSGTKAPRESWKAHRSRLEKYKTSLNAEAAKVKGSDGSSFRKVRAQAVATIRQARTALTSGNRRM